MSPQDLIVKYPEFLRTAICPKIGQALQQVERGGQCAKASIIEDFTVGEIISCTDPKNAYGKGHPLCPYSKVWERKSL